MSFQGSMTVDLAFLGAENEGGIDCCDWSCLT